MVLIPERGKKNPQSPPPLAAPPRRTLRERLQAREPHPKRWKKSPSDNRKRESVELTLKKRKRGRGFEEEGD
jgi:hypothetical protein